MSILGYKQAPGSKIWQSIPELILDKVIKTTRPRENGQTDGSRNYPEADSRQLAETENRIVYEVENYLKSVADMANKEFTDITREMEPLSLAGVEDDFIDLKLGAEKDFNRYSLKALPELKKLRVAERRELRNLKLFKEQNDLDRLAKYPPSRLLHIALLFLCLLAECGANMYYFSAGTDLGYLGGFFQAFGVSAGNIAISFTCGCLALTNMHHISKLRVFFGACGFGLWLGVIFVYHLLVAHYRDLLLIDPDNALLGAWDKFRAAPFGFESMESGVVLLIGLIISIAALLDGFKYDDSYPGYGKHDRDYQEKADELDNAESAVRETMVSTITDAEKRINKRLSGYEEREKKLADLYTGAASVVEHFENIYQQVDEIVHSAVNTYREANLRVRTEEVPVSFSKMPIVERLLRQEQYVRRLETLRAVKETTSTQLLFMRKSASAMLTALAEETENMGRKIEALNDEVDKKAKEQIKQDSEVA